MDRPKSIQKWSPNFTPKDPGRAISCVIIHATATPDKDSPLSWLTNPESKVSAHYVVDSLGGIWHLVHEQNIAWHAGESEFNGMSGVNNFSIGIELVNPNDDKTPYPQEQIDACSGLVSAICLDYGITSNAVVGHCDIAPGRKTDPGKAFPWDDFRMSLIKEGVKEG